MYSPEPRITHKHIKNLWNRHRNVPLRIRQCGDHIVTTLIRSQLDGIHRRAPTPECPRYGKTTLVVHVQSNHGGAGPTHFNAVPHSKHDKN